MDVDYIRQIPIDKERYSYTDKERYTYTKSRTTNIFDEILNDDVPSIVKHSYSKAVEDNIPTYTSPYTTTSPYRSSFLNDDINFKARPNTDYVVNRDYHQYSPLPRWNDTFESSPQFPEIHRERSPYRTPTIYSETNPLSSNYMPSYVPRSSLLLEKDPPQFDRYSTKPKADRTKPYFLKPELPRFYPSQTKPEDASWRISSRLNTAFPFRKYRSDFVPYAPYHNMYDSMKYCPNPDWVTMRPWGHRFRKARFVYVPEDKNSCMSMEIERVMREARMRELCKGIYSSSYGDDITSRVNLATGLLDNKSNSSGPQPRRQPLKAAEAEIAPTHGEKERRKPMSLADKRKRNETLAVGLSRTELLKNDNETSSLAPTTVTAPPKQTTPTPKPKQPTPPPKDPTPPPPREPTPPPPKDPTPPPPKEPTPPPPKEPTPPPPKDPTPPPPKEPTPPPKEPSPPPKEATPPPPEICMSPPKEPTPPPPKKEPTPPPPKEPTPPPKDPTPPPKESTPPPEDVSPPSEEEICPEEEITPPEESTPPPQELVPPPSSPVADESSCPALDDEPVEETYEVENATNDPSVEDQRNAHMEEPFHCKATGNYMVEELDNGDGQIIRTEYMIEEIEVPR